MQSNPIARKNGKKALITGITGQDGSYLAEFLLSKGYEVSGLMRRSGQGPNPRLQNFQDKINIVYGDLTDPASLALTLNEIKPDEIYNLGAQSFVALSWDSPQYTMKSTGQGAANMLDMMRQITPDARFYQASSSEMFGEVLESPQNEETCFNPQSPYGVAKVSAHFYTKVMNESFNLDAVSGILFNHESPRRGIEFVTRKITYAIANIIHGKQEKISLGNIESKRDWGYAPEYIEAMWKMLQQDTSKGDNFCYVISTGETYTIKHFVEKAFAIVDRQIQWEGEGVDEKGLDKKTGELLVDVNPEFFRPAEVKLLVGDSTKAREKLGWTPRISLDEMIKRMVMYDIYLVEKNLPLYTPEPSPFL